MKRYPYLLAAAAIAIATSQLSSQTDCYTEQFCSVSACTNVGQGPFDAYTDFYFGNGLVFGNECVKVETYEMDAGGGGEYRPVEMRQICTGGTPNPYVSDRCGDRYAGTAAGGGCNVVVGACGRMAVTVGC